MTGSLVGYARVSTIDQNPQAQIEALEQAGCIRVFTDHASGVKDQRPQFDTALDYLRAGDTLVVWRLDRLGRSLPHLLTIVQDLGQCSVGFRSLTEAIDTTTPTGRLLFHIAGAFSQFERDIIRERTLAGVQAAKAVGRIGGRPTVMNPERIDAARALHASGASQVAIAAALGVSRATIRRTLKTDPARR